MSFHYSNQPVKSLLLMLWFVGTAIAVSDLNEMIKWLFHEPFFPHEWFSLESFSRQELPTVHLKPTVAVHLLVLVADAIELIFPSEQVCILIQRHTPCPVFMLISHLVCATWHLTVFLLRHSTIMLPALHDFWGCRHLLTSFEKHPIWGAVLSYRAGIECFHCNSTALCSCISQAFCTLLASLLTGCRGEFSSLDSC